MLIPISISICLFFIILTGWTLTTYFVKEHSQQLISEELKNLFDICKKLFLSLKKLIGILASHSLSSETIGSNPVEKNVLDENNQPLSLVQPIKEIEEPSLEVEDEKDDDTALSSFSPEVIEVINEEEEKVA